jgi:hypothetical protein
MRILYALKGCLMALGLEPPAKFHDQPLLPVVAQADILCLELGIQGLASGANPICLIIFHRARELD